MIARPIAPSRALALVALAFSIFAALPRAASPQPSQAAPPGVRGTVSGVDADGQPFRIPGVAVELARPGADAVTVYSDDRGEFEFSAIVPGPYALQATLPGFEPFVRTVVIAAGQTVTVDVRLEPARLREEVTVVAGGDERLVQPQAIAPPSEIKQHTIQQVPLASEHFQAALPLVPGVVRGPDGTLNMNGARESQSGLRVNSASVTDPVTGEFAFQLPVEAIRSVQVVTRPYAPEYGQVTGGVTTIETTTGTDHWKFQVQDIEPRLRRRDDVIRGIESWTPRIAIGGPVAGPDLTVFESVEYQFVRTLVEGLPANEGDTKLESFSSFTQVDWAATPADHVSVATAVFPQRREFLGLDSFNPQPVTPNLDQHGYLWTVSERRVASPTSVLLAHFSVKRLDSDVFPSTGGGLMVLAPDQNGGSYFNTQRRDSRRYEGASEYTTTPAAWGGSHFVKVGGGVSHDVLDGDTVDRPVLIVGPGGAPLERTGGGGPVPVVGTNTAAFVFAQDAWTAGSRLSLDYGLRYDHETVAGTHHVAPRVGASFTPTADGRTVIRGGAGLFFGRLTLNAATFDQLPPRVVTRFADGDPALASSTVQHPSIDAAGLENPESVVWNLEVDRELTKRVAIRVGYQQRDGWNEPIVDLAPAMSGETAVLLSSVGRARYRELEVTGRYRAAANQFAMSYVRSSAMGDLNDINLFAGNVESPIVRPNQYSRLPYDAPNRLLAWGEFELPHGWGVAPLVEVRDGFPFSIYDAAHDFVGMRNQAGRFPRFFSLDTQLWKRIALPWPRGLKARVGIKVFNITNHFNPRDFQGNLASSRFGGFSNGVSRTFRGKFVFDF